jgi:hypothetical protein
LAHVYVFAEHWVGSRGNNLFVLDTIYQVELYVYLVQMINYYEWVLCTIGRNGFTIHVVSLTYYKDTHIEVKFDEENALEEFLNIELTEILDGDIRGYDAEKNILYSAKLILEFKEQFAARNEQMKELDIFYL